MSGGMTEHLIVLNNECMSNETLNFQNMPTIIVPQPENRPLLSVSSDNLFIFSFYISKTKTNCIADKET